MEKMDEIGSRLAHVTVLKARERFFWSGPGANGDMRAETSAELAHQINELHRLGVGLDLIAPVAGRRAMIRHLSDFVENNTRMLITGEIAEHDRYRSQLLAEIAGARKALPTIPTY